MMCIINLGGSKISSKLEALLANPTFHGMDEKHKELPVELELDRKHPRTP